MKNDFFRYCPVCGSKKVRDVNDRKWVCDDCGFTLYNNVASAVGLIISDKNNNILFEVRAKEPRKGFLALPGGFSNPDETAEAAALRECKEETGLEPVFLNYLCSFPNTYEYKSVIYKTCDLFFTAKIESEASDSLLSRLHRQESEVSGFVLKTISSINDIDELPIGFDSSKKALRLWFGNRQEKR